MINLLPQNIKQDRKYGRLNRFLFGQVILFLMIGLVAVAVMLSAIRLVSQTDEKLVKEIEQKTKAYQNYSQVEAEAKKVNSQLKSIQLIYDKEIKFSELIQDIASALPINTSLKSLSLTGTKVEPLQIIAQVPSQRDAAVLRKSLVDSEIFESADIVAISPTRFDINGSAIEYEVVVNVEFTGTAEVKAKLRAEQEAQLKAAQEAAQQNAGSN